MPNVIIRFEEPDAWQQQQEKIDEILKEAAGIEPGNYVSTRSFPPIHIIPDGLNDEAIAKLNELEGVKAEARNDDE